MVFKYFSDIDKGKIMSKILVIGASGQLGSIVLDQLLETGQECVAFVRPSCSYRPPVSELVQVVHGDLADFSSVDKACVGIKQVIATASSMVPRQGDKSGVDDVENYQHLIKACQRHKVEHLVYISGFSSHYDELISDFRIIRIKRQVEQIIVGSGIPFTIFRGAAFMDIYYAVMGSRLAMNGVSQPTLLRGFWLTKLYSKLTTGLLENYGIALLPGNGKARHAFVCIHDVAAFMVKALAVPTAQNRIIDLGGPEILSWQNVADIYSDLLGKKIIKLAIPSFILNACRLALRPLSPAGENIMSILFLYGRYDSVLDMTALSKEFSIRMTDTRQFLLGKLNSQHAAGNTNDRPV
jgi:uncharacterized protein YbjT (DUF2867 family)